MPSRRATSLQLAAIVAIAATLGPATAGHAETMTAMTATTAAAGQIGVSAAPISTAQLDAFADLVGESRADVEQRLAWHPDLVPYASAAGSKRLVRQSTGKSMTIAGFTLLGAGSTIGFLVGLSGVCFGLGEDCKAREAQAERTGEVIILASVGVGLLLAIPGILKMARPSDMETQAVRMYQATEIARPSVFPANTNRALAPVQGLSVPLLSATF